VIACDGATVDPDADEATVPMPSLSLNWKIRKPHEWLVPPVVEDTVIEVVAVAVVV
jgi:hypothetical protein